MTIRLTRAEIVEDVFGIWPSFHDAEITEITLKRETILQRLDTAIFLELLTYGPPSVQGQFRVRFAFHECDDVELLDFNYQNVISQLTLNRVTQPRSWREEPEERIKVNIGSIFGAAFSFTCSTGEVLDMTPTDDTQ
jgi:hypothetical protein